MKILITEEEKEEILSSHKDNGDEELMRHLRRYCPVFQMENDEFNISGKNRILVDDKLYRLRDNKKKLVNIIYWEVKDGFEHLGDNIIRKTIKKYLDMIKDV